MNVHDDESCKREIYHRVRTPLMVFKYYFTHLEQLPVAIITTIVIILFTVTLFSKRYYYILFCGLFCFFVYVVIFIFDWIKYRNFRNEIIGNN